ncbi:MAG: MerR family DNA-binding transcriptional regulator [Promethearchaeota archaeon]
MLVRIGVAAAALGVCARTLRRWEAAGKLLPACRTVGGHRRYETTSLPLPGGVAGGRACMGAGGNAGGARGDAGAGGVAPTGRAVAYARVVGVEDLRLGTEGKEGWTAKIVGQMFTNVRELVLGALPWVGASPRPPVRAVGASGSSKRHYADGHPVDRRYGADYAVCWATGEEPPHKGVPLVVDAHVDAAAAEIADRAYRKGASGTSGGGGAPGPPAAVGGEA